MKHYLVLFFLTILTFTSCISTQEVCSIGTFKFKQKPDDINISSSLISFLKSNPACKIVLRVPTKPDKIAEEGGYINKPLYFSIEKILLDNYYRVIDQSLFEKKISENNSLEKTADLILELVNYKLVNYYTDKVVPEDNKNEKEITLSRFYYFTGAQATFKIIDIRTCEIVATFILNYTPCTKGCKLRYCSSGRIEEIKNEKTIRKKLVTNQ